MHGLNVFSVTVLLVATMSDIALAQNGKGFDAFGVKKLAYETGPGNWSAPHEDIFVLDSLNSKPRHLASGISAVWSPDGQKIAYCVHEGWGTKHITLGQMHLINADGSGDKQLTNLAGGACPNAWSPDGQKISSTQGVLVLGSDRESVSVQSGIRGLWSPDGKKLAFWKYRDNRQGTGSIWVANADGSDARKVIDDNSEVVRICWSSDGDSLLFSSHRGNSKRMEIFRIRLDGSHLETIATDKELSFHVPLISPDGKYLIVGARGGDNDVDSIIAIDLATQKRTSLAHGNLPHILWAAQTPN
jgi:Tol biopolymer transport system component